MSEWTSTLPGYRTKTIQHGSCTIIVHRPVLTEQERTKREKQIQDSLGRGLSEYLRRKEMSAQ
jgi:hypothetical protein